MEVHIPNPSRIKSTRVIVPVRLLPQPKLAPQPSNNSGSSDDCVCCTSEMPPATAAISDAVSALMLLGQQQPQQPGSSAKRKRSVDEPLPVDIQRRRSHHHHQLTPLETLATVATVALGCSAAEAKDSTTTTTTITTTITTTADLLPIDLRRTVRQVDFACVDWHSNLADYGHQLTELTLVDCAITRLTLRQILQGTPNIVKLTLANLSDASYGCPLPSPGVNWKLVRLTHLSVRIAPGPQTTAHWPLSRYQTPSLDDVNLEFEGLAGYMDEQRSWFEWLEVAGHLVKRLRIVGCSLAYSSWHRILGTVPNLRHLLIAHTVRLNDGLMREVPFIDTITHTCGTIREQQIVPALDWKLTKLETLRLFEFGECCGDNDDRSNGSRRHYLLQPATSLRDLLSRVPSTLQVLAVIGGPDPSTEVALMAKACSKSLTELTISKSYWDALNALPDALEPMAYEPSFPQIATLAVVPGKDPCPSLLTLHDLLLIAKHCGTVSRLIVPTCELTFFYSKLRTKYLANLGDLTVYQPNGKLLVPRRFRSDASSLRATA